MKFKFSMFLLYFLGGDEDKYVEFGLECKLLIRFFTSPLLVSTVLSPFRLLLNPISYHFLQTYLNLGFISFITTLLIIGLTNQNLQINILLLPFIFPPIL